MIFNEGSEWAVNDVYYSFAERAADPATPQANQLRLYAKDKAGVSALYYKDDAGNVKDLSASGATVAIGGAVTGGTTGSVLFVGAGPVLAQDNANFFWDDTNNRLGIGITAPVAMLHLQNNAATTEALTIDVYGADGLNIRGRRALGTLASPTQLTTDEHMIMVSGLGYHSGGAFSGAQGRMTIAAAENFTNIARGTYVAFHSTPIGSVTMAERLRLGPAGQIGIGGATYGTAGNLIKSGGPTAAVAWQDHTADFLTQYALLAGRSGGQTLIGGTAASNALTLQSSSNATRGDIVTDCADITMVAASKARMAGQNRFRHLNSIARVFQDTGTSQSLNDSTITTINFDGEDIDTDALHTTGGSNSRISALLTGKHLVMGSIQWELNGTGARSAYIAVNGVTTTLESSIPGMAGGNNPTNSFVDLLSLTAGDYVELQGHQNSGGALGVIVGTAANTHLGLYYIGE